MDSFISYRQFWLQSEMMTTRGQYIISILINCCVVKPGQRELKLNKGMICMPNWFFLFSVKSVLLILLLQCCVKGTSSSTKGSKSCRWDVMNCTVSWRSRRWPREWPSNWSPKALNRQFLYEEKMQTNQAASGIRCNKKYVCLIHCLFRVRKTHVKCLFLSVVRKILSLLHSSQAVINMLHSLVNNTCEAEETWT